MFFKLSKQLADNFTECYTLPNGLVLNTDEGWSEYQYDETVIILKGYANNYNLERLSEQLLFTRTPCIVGNFCAFICTKDRVRLTHDTHRAFPLWACEECVTNLSSCGEQIWADCVITIDSNLNTHPEWFQPYALSAGTDDEIVESIHNTLLSSFEQFLTHNTKPLKLYLSGGLDTATLWAYLDHFTKDYEIVDYEYLKHTHFYKHNGDAIRRHQLYRQIHLWEEDTVLVSGSMGDENFLRGPLTLGVKLRSLGVEFADMLKPEDYMYSFIMDKHDKVLKELNEVYDDIDNVNDWILNLCVNDHQHWHLDRTITYTPFKDISILSRILGCSKDLIVDHGRNGEIQRRLISKLDSDKLNVVSVQKNRDGLASV